MRHLLVTNDFPPKVGGIQSYLWELWRRLPPEEVTVLTTPSAGADAFDRSQRFRIERTHAPVLLPTPGLARLVRRLTTEVEAGLVVLDPALPLGSLGPRLGLPYAVILHGAEATLPARVPIARSLLTQVLARASGIVAAGDYPARQVDGLRAGVPVAVVAPGVDTARFRVLGAAERAAARADLGLSSEGPLIVSLSRLVPRKGMDVLISAGARLAPRFPGLRIAIAGTGRDRTRLARRAAAVGAPVAFLGRVADETLPRLYGCADVFAMLCRSRWWGLEEEGFGIVFLEAASCGVAQVAGNSGGAADAVADGQTGIVVSDPRDVTQVTEALERLLADDELRHSQAKASRVRAEAEFSYDELASRLRAALGAFVT